MEQHLAYIGIGSNLDHPLEQIRTAVSHITRLPSTKAIELSPIYCSGAVGPGEQPDYLNAVAKLTTSAFPEHLLDELQHIEDMQRRVRSERWGPRTIDLDILLFDRQVINTPRLTVPHPFMTERNFVLVPLLDLDPNLHMPQGLAISDLISVIGRDNLSLHQETT